MASGTIGSGFDFADIATFEAQVNGNNQVGTISAAAALDSSSVTIDTGFSGTTVTADSSSAVSSPTYSNANSKGRITASLTVNDASAVIEKFSVFSTTFGVRCTGSNTGMVVRRMFLRATGGVNNYGLRVESTAGATLTNLAISARGSNVNGIEVLDTGACAAYQCSIVTSNDAYSAFYFYFAGTTTCSGVVGQGKSTDVFRINGSISGDYNVSEGSDAPGANSLQSQSGVFVDNTSGSEDLTLSGSPTVNIVNRSGFPADTDTDISGTSRPSTGADAGCWQTPAAAAGGQPTARRFGQVRYSPFRPLGIEGVGVN